MVWQVVGILAPEHGFRGDRQAETGDPDEYPDPVTGVHTNITGINPRTLRMKTNHDHHPDTARPAGIFNLPEKQYLRTATPPQD